MKIIFSLVCVFNILHLALAGSSDDECVSWAKKTAPLSNCCKFIAIFSTETKTSALDAIPKNVEQNSTLYYCHFAQSCFEKSNVSSFDETSFKNYFEKVITDHEWLPVIKNASDHCVASGLKHATSDQTDTGVSKDECDAKFMYFLVCLSTYSKMFCPEKGFIKSDKCMDTKRFLVLCGDSEKAVEAYADLHKKEF